MNRPRLVVGDVRQVMERLADRSVDLIITSPPFLRLRSYLPGGHPDKGREIGAEATPAAYLDVLLRLTADWARVLTPQGSLAVELGDSYSGSAGGGSGRGWPLAKSLAGVPEAYMLSLAYGRNVLSGDESPAGMWRVRNFKPVIRTNPPVGALSDKERPATSYVIVATQSRSRYFDLDAVRHANPRAGETASSINHRRARAGRDPGNRHPTIVTQNPSGAPPLDWTHHVDVVLDAALRDNASGNSHPRTRQGVHRRANSGKSAACRRGGNWATLDVEHQGHTGGIRGWHLRRALEQAGILTTLDALAVNPARYKGAHYAVWPAELVRVLVEEMCPRRVCRTCGSPSRRPGRRRTNGNTPEHGITNAPTWTSCGCPGTEPDDRDGWHAGHGWRQGRVLDPFAGSGTTLDVAAGLDRDVVGIDLDQRNVRLVRERCGPALVTTTVHDTQHEITW